MKRVWMIFLACILIFVAGCKKNAANQAVETTAQVVAETESSSTVTEENIPTTCGTARVHNTPAVLSIRMRGDLVDVVGLYDENHYVIRTAEGYGLVRREFIRMKEEPAYEVWNGYAYGNAEFHTDIYLIGDPVQKLKTNTKVEVLEDLGYCYVVQAEQTLGFMKRDQISKWWISTGGGGSSGSGEKSTPAGQDGGEISLQFHASIQLLSAIAQTGEVTGTGTILADGTEVILGYFARGEEIPVVMEAGFAENKTGFYTVYLDGLYAWVSEKFVCMDAETYAQWDGYAQWSALVYDDYHLLGSPKDKLNTNTRIRVVGELENCYLVEIEGVPGFVEKDMVSKDRITYGGSDGSGDRDGNDGGNAGGNNGSTGGNNGSTGGNNGSTGGNNGSTGDNNGSTGSNNGSTGDNNGSTGDNNGSNNGSTGGNNSSTGDNNGSTGDNNDSTGDNNDSTGDNNDSTGDNSGSTGDNNGSTGDDNGSTGDNNGSTGDNSGSTGNNNGSTGDNSGTSGGSGGTSSGGDPEWTPPIL